MSGWVRRGGFIGVLALLIASAAWTSPEAAPQVVRVVVTMEEPFSVQGRMYPGGRLTLRAIGDACPGTSLHEVALDGSTVGVLPAHREGVEGRPRATALFGRDVKGRLHLIGYVGTDREIYRF
jgi:hypothetical protein